MTHPASASPAPPLDAARAERMLRDHGLRVTSPRVAVIRSLAARPHATADAIRTDVIDHLGTISVQATYDVLAALTSAGVLRRIEPAESPALFELDHGDNHHHAVCRSCRSVVDVECAVGAAPCLQHSGPDGFVVDEAEIVWWGLCATCAATIPS